MYFNFSYSEFTLENLLMKFNKFLPLSLTVLFLLFPSFLTAKEETQKLSGSIVKGIVEQFVSMHYSQKPLNDEMSLRIFSLYMNRLDPAHYYFLASDVNEFRVYETRIDDMLHSGDVKLALDIFERFKTRLSERLAMMEEFLSEDFDFTRDAKWTLDRSNLPYPESSEAAREIWRTKIKFDLLFKNNNYLDSNLSDSHQTVSGGQKQVIGTARALYRGGDILVMDEATNAMDTKLEKSIFEAIPNFDFCNLVCITHRSNLLQEFDTIYIFNNGEIEDYGTYETLIERNDFLLTLLKDKR